MNPTFSRQSHVDSCLSFWNEFVNHKARGILFHSSVSEQRGFSVYNEQFGQCRMIFGSPSLRKPSCIIAKHSYHGGGKKHVGVINLHMEAQTTRNNW